jgi:general secretion pathway protein I
MTPQTSRQPRSRRATGFTLIEVLAAVVLVGIVVPVAMEAISLSLRSASDAKRKVEAAMLAENKLSELTTNLVLQTPGATSGNFAPDWPDYHWDSAIVQRDVDLSELQVRVLWNSRGADRVVSLSTFVFTGVPTTTESGGG